jgi:hypothetical protein
VTKPTVVLLFSLAGTKTKSAYGIRGKKILKLVNIQYPSVFTTVLQKKGGWVNVQFLLATLYEKHHLHD